jgi:ABC-type multidrug transport system fused ATPase/permease subunit
MKNENNILRNFWKRFWILIEPSRKQIKALLIITIVFEAARMVGPYILKLIIDRLANFNTAEIGQVLLLIALMFLGEQTVAMINHFRGKRTLKMLIEIEYYLPVKVHKKLVNLSLSYHVRENTGNKITKIEKGINKITDLTANLSFEVVPTLLQLAVTLIVLIFVDWRFSVSFAIFAPLFIFATYKINKDLNPMRKIRHRNYEIASGKMGESIININTVKSFVQEKKEIKKYSEIKENIRTSELKEWYRLFNFDIGRSFIIDTGRISILLFGVYLVWQSAITIGTLVFVVTLTEKAYISLYRLSRFYDRAEEGAEAVNRFMDILDEEPLIKNPENGLKPKKIAGQIKFKNVNFAYEDDKNPALKNVNIEISSGCVTALVGPSGGGKTTVAKMIYRHYDPQKGAVLMDDVSLKELDLFYFRKAIAIVPQEVEIFNVSVRENIGYAKDRTTFAEIKSAACIANAEEFIAKLPQGYDTLIGERGVKLSGGQRQRIGIARAILANPRILIFDEATSSLDSASEKLIQDAMEKIRKGRTMIIIAHRLSTIKKADKIIVLEGGRVAEQGSHFELAKASGGIYAKLLKLQEMGDVE